jgi:serine phosphatase RsbU (regulator of sigma subunit)
MTMANTALRLAQEFDEPIPPIAPATPALVKPTIGAVLDEQIEVLQSQITSLSDEINALRKRDETVNFYMHRIDEEMRLAARLQQDFLPKSLPQIGPVHFTTLFRPAGYVSGDLYDVMRLDETHIGFYMADAVGHGMPAALLTMFIKNALVTKEINPAGYRLLPPSETMSHLNEALVGQNLSYATFATAIYGHINTQTLEVSLARGGHPNPIILRADGTTETVPADGSLLGIFEGEKFTQATTKLNVGDRLMIFSDGIEVAFADDKELDTDRWRREIEQRRHLTSHELIESLEQHLDNSSGSLSPKDDLTIILVDVK